MLCPSVVFKKIIKNKINLSGNFTPCFGHNSKNIVPIYLSPGHSTKHYSSYFCEGSLQMKLRLQIN